MGEFELWTQYPGSVVPLAMLLYAHTGNPPNSFHASWFFFPPFNSTHFPSKTKKWQILWRWESVCIVSCVCNDGWSSHAITRFQGGKLQALIRILFPLTRLVIRWSKHSSHWSTQVFASMLLLLQHSVCALLAVGLTRWSLLPEPKEKIPRNCTTGWAETRWRELWGKAAYCFRPRGSKLQCLTKNMPSAVKHNGLFQKRLLRCRWTLNVWTTSKKALG